MRSFASDNNSTVHPRVMESITAANADHAFGYGDDPWTDRATMMVEALFSRPSVALFTFNGTGSNTMALQLLTRSYHIIFTAETGHIAVDECGAPTKATGCITRQIPTPDGKLTPALLQPYMINFGIEHHSQPGAIYLSQCTELGTIYTPEELTELCDFAHQYGMKVHLDGARIANAAVALNKSIDEVSAACGIDSMVLGGTKNGLMGAECVVVFDPSLAIEARYARKQACQLASKMRYISAQFVAYLADDLWKECATRANVMARKLADALSQKSYVHFTQKVESNQLFLTLPREVSKELEKHFHFYYWDEAIGEIRLVASHDTSDADIHSLINILP
ncbi:threonine aldolase family protein [Porphyromonas levii]|uniref:threonine aldolase family protein n=1 Tax=Porphyromonas levii TaxID=28114 RepID=UPI00035EE2AA|nr:beta-eliminating lyase-related protein [Porphyromonas levii]